MHELVQRNLLTVPWYSYERKKWNLKLHFSASNLDRIIFSNVHRLPRKSSATASSTSATASPIVVKCLTMKDRNSILNQASHARQFKNIALQSTFHWQCRLNDVLSSILQIHFTNKESESSGKLSTQTTDSLLTVIYSLLKSKCLTICYLNACSIFAYNSALNLAELGAVTNFYGFDIICVTETWLDSSVSNNLLRLSGFCPPFHLDRNRHGGAVLAYVKCKIFCQRRLDLECAGTEILWL